MRLFLLALCFFGISGVAQAQSADDFVFTFTTRSSFESQRRCTLIITTNNNITVSWGDGQTQTFAGPIDPAVSGISHLYTTAGTYTVRIQSFTGALHFSYIASPIIDVQQWGTTTFTSLRDFAYSVNDFSISATDLPNLNQCTDLSSAFSNSLNFNSDISNWDVSNVTDLSSMFTNTRSFNQDISNWDVSNVTSMSNMFSGHSGTAFNQDISNWDVSNVTNMNSMFTGARFFNQDLSNWDVSSVTDMGNMFGYSLASFSARVFTSDLSNWDVSNVTNMYEMFYNATNFNSDLSNWDVSNITNMSGMFSGAQSFNGDISTWDVSNVTDMNRMFRDAISFNSDISTWDVSNVTNMNFMFGCLSFNSTSTFSSDLSSWDVSNVTNMGDMFRAAISFNADISGWDVSNVTYMPQMFRGATAFNQPLNTWQFHPNVILNSMVARAGFDVQNYDLLLSQFARLNLAGRQFDSDALTYCDSFSRGVLISNGWSITGDTQVSNCTSSTLNGSVFYDFDNNGCNATDISANRLPIEISNGVNAFTIFTDDSLYSISLPPANYTLTPQVNTALFNSSPSSSSLTLAAGVTATQDFCLTATTPIDDLEITILPLEDARPGFDTYYKLIYKNNGNTQLSGSVSLTYEDDYMDFVTATPAATNASTGLLQWDFTNLDPFETREILLGLNMNTPTVSTFPLNSGDLLDFSATVTHTGTEATPADNVFNLQQTVVNSYDPNDKTNLNGNTLDPSKVGEYVHYRIRFENEGTASAVNVRIVDYIDLAKFDIETLVPLSGSHDFTTTISQGNKVEFKFDNIMLPFTAPASQGYVLFKIKTKSTLVLGDDFSNDAEIYFDFNFPIYTNVETTLVALNTASVSDTKLFEVKLFPNPATSEVTVSSNSAFSTLAVYDAVGKQVARFALTSTTLNHTLNTDSLAPGMYFVEIMNNDGTVVEKLLKQ